MKFKFGDKVRVKGIRIGAIVVDFDKSPNCEEPYLLSWYVPKVGAYQTWEREKDLKRGWPKKRQPSKDRGKR